MGTHKYSEHNILWQFLQFKEAVTVNSKCSTFTICNKYHVVEIVKMLSNNYKIYRNRQMNIKIYYYLVYC